MNTNNIFLSRKSRKRRRRKKEEGKGVGEGEEDRFQDSFVPKTFRSFK